MGKEAKTILLVEDDLDVQDAVSFVLRREGHRVLIAGNGEEALGLMRGEGLPSLILLDLMMPVMDGWQFRVEQLKDPQLAGVPVIVVSADARAAKQAAQMGAADYLKKPFEFEQLVDVVARHD